MISFVAPNERLPSIADNITPQHIQKSREIIQSCECAVIKTPPGSCCEHAQKTPEPGFRSARLSPAPVPLTSTDESNPERFHSRGPVARLPDHGGVRRFLRDPFSSRTRSDYFRLCAHTAL